MTRTHARLPGLNRRLVLELDRGRVRELLLVVALSGLILLPLLVYVWLNVEWIQAGYQIEKLKNQRDQLVEAQHQLRLEKASLENLQRVERMAASRLGLSEPPGGTVVQVDMKRLRPAPPPVTGKLARAGNRPDRGDGDPNAADTDTN